MGKRCTRSNKNILLPPMISHFAKMDAERRAKKKQLTKVKIEIVKETEKGYEDVLGKEAMQVLRTIQRGEEWIFQKNFIL